MTLEYTRPRTGDGSTARLPYVDRREAGRVLARHLRAYAGRDDVIVLAVPRGGVPVGAVVAQALDAGLDVIVVRKLGAPEQPELALGAVGLGGIRVLNEDIIALARVPPTVLDTITRDEAREVQRRERLYRGDRPMPPLRGRCAILVDDGLATGATMEAAVAVVRREQPSRIVVAVPVAPPETIPVLRAVADEVVCPATPPAFTGVGAYYLDFEQLTDADVRDVLDGHPSPPPSPQ